MRGLAARRGGKRAGVAAAFPPSVARFVDGKPADGEGRRSLAGRRGPPQQPEQDVSSRK